MARWRVPSEWLSRARLFLVSYAPLSFMFAARFYSKDDMVAVWTFSAVGAWGALDGIRLLRGAKRKAKRTVIPTEIADSGQAVSGYLATYLLPFLGNLPESGGDWIAIGLYFLVALVIYVRTDIALINPTLYLYGYRVSRAVVASQEVLVISRSKVAQGSSIRVTEFLDVMIVR